MDTQSIGERLKMLRKKANLSVDELSNIIGKDRATVYRYERGDIRKLPFELLEPLAKAFNVTPADIVGIADEDNLILSNEEKQLVLAYRNQPEMKQAVNKLLGIAESPPIVQTKRCPIDQLVVKDERIACYETEQIGQPVSKEKEAEAKKLANQLKEREQKENEELKKLFEKARESQKDIF